MLCDALAGKQAGPGVQRTHYFGVLQLYMPPTGYVNNCDGGRSHTYCDYRQQ